MPAGGAKSETSGLLGLQGPREDSGVVHTDNPGVGLLHRIYNYVHAHGNGKSVVMASGVRTSAGAAMHPSFDLFMGCPFKQTDDRTYKRNSGTCHHVVTLNGSDPCS